MGFYITQIEKICEKNCNLIIKTSHITYGSVSPAFHIRPPALFNLSATIT